MFGVSKAIPSFLGLPVKLMSEALVLGPTGGCRNIRRTLHALQDSEPNEPWKPGDKSFISKPLTRLQALPWQAARKITLAGIAGIGGPSCLNPKPLHQNAYTKTSRFWAGLSFRLSL